MGIPSLITCSYSALAAKCLSGNCPRECVVTEIPLVTMCGVVLRVDRFKFNAGNSSKMGENGGWSVIGHISREEVQA